MWIEKTEYGTFKAIERYTDPKTGKRRKVSINIEKDNKASRTAAQEALTAKIEAIVNASELERRLTLSKLKKIYIDAQKETVRKQTWHRNENVLQHAIEIIGEDVLIDELKAKDIISRLKLSEKSNTTLNGYLMRLKAMMRWGYDNEYLDDIAFVDRLKSFPDEKKKEKLQDKYLESAELDALLEKMKEERWKLLTQFLALSGLRIGEAMVLNNDDIDDTYIHVTKTYQFIDDIVEEGTKTDTSYRDVYVQPELRKCIDEIRLFRKVDMLKYGYRNELFFPWKNGGIISYDAYRAYLARRSREIGHEITPHALRHTHVSLLAENGVSLDVIARRVGHADSEITKRIYLHITEKRRDKDNDALKNISLLGQSESNNTDQNPEVQPSALPSALG